MSHTVNPIVLRLGYKLNWTFLHNNIYLSKTFRFTLLINAILFGFFKKYNYTLVKYFVNLETTKCKIFVIALRNFGIGRKPIDFSFFKWSKAYKVAFFKIKKKFTYSIKHYRLKSFLKNWDFDRFKKAQNIIKKYSKGKKISLTFNNFKQFRLNQVYDYFYKNFVRTDLKNLFSNLNISALSFKKFLNTKKINSKFYFLNIYNIYNFYTLWVKSLISNLSNKYFLKTFDKKGFSPFWIKRYKFFDYFNVKSKLFFLKFLNFKKNNITSFFNLNKNKKKIIFTNKLFSSFFNRFLKLKYLLFYNFSFFNYNLLNILFYFLLKLKLIFFYFSFFFNKNNFLKYYIILLYNIYNKKLFYIFNKNNFFFNKINFFKYYFNNINYILQLNKKITNNNLINIFSIINSSKKVYYKPKTNFYKNLTYYTHPIEYDKRSLKYLKFKFVKNLRLDSHLFSKYSFPFLSNEALSYKIMHDSMLRDAHNESKIKFDSTNKEIKNYNNDKKGFYIYKLKKYFLIKKKFNKLFFFNQKNNIKFSNKKNLILAEKLNKKINFFNRFLKNNNLSVTFNKINFFSKNFCSLFINNIFIKLNKKINILNYLFLDNNNNIFINNFFLKFNSYINYNKQISLLIKDIFLKYSFLNKFNSSSFSINFNLLLYFKTNLINLFYFNSYNLKFNFIKFNFIKFNFNTIIYTKNYNLLSNLFNFFYFKNFNLYSFFYKSNLFNHKRGLLFNVYSIWLKKKKFFFFLEKEFEKIFRINTNIIFINPLSNFLTNDHGLSYIKSAPFLINKVYIHPKEKKNMVYFLIIFFLALKFRATYLLSSYLTIMIEKREKHFEFFTVLKRVMGIIKISEFNLSGLTIGLYGKVNGKDRAYRYFIHRFIKPSVRKQCMILNSELTHCYSRYGVFGVRIWMHEF